MLDPESRSQGETAPVRNFAVDVSLIAEVPKRTSRVVLLVRNDETQWIDAAGSWLATTKRLVGAEVSDSRNHAKKQSSCDVFPSPMKKEILSAA